MKRYPFSSFVPLLLAFASLAGAADRADSVKAAAESASSAFFRAHGGLFGVRDAAAVIEPGSISTNVGALVIGDRRREADEMFDMNLLLANRGSILDSRGICTITNDDN
jgi:hypothetical protein